MIILQWHRHHFDVSVSVILPTLLEETNLMLSKTFEHFKGKFHKVSLDFRVNFKKKVLRWNWKHIFLTKGKSLFSLWSHCGLRTARTDVRPCRRPGLHWWRLGAPRAGTSNKHYCYCNPAPHIKHTFNTNAQLLPTFNSANFNTNVISSG